MTYIVYESDHLNRALKMNGITDSAGCQDVKADPVRVKGLDTLTMWGHGTEAFFCGMDANGLHRKVKDWIKVNSGIKTVEIITCNSRHAKNGALPFVSRLKPLFRFSRVKLKSLPVRMGAGGVGGDSILFADYKSATWSYLTTPNEATFFTMKDLLGKHVIEKKFNDDAIRGSEYLLNAPPMSSQTGSYYSTHTKPGKTLTRPEFINNPALHRQVMTEFYGNNVDNLFKDLEASPAFRARFVQSRTYTINYGSFMHLRNQLVTL